jgi:signal transduction histidine kinase
VPDTTIPVVLIADLVRAASVVASQTELTAVLEAVVETGMDLTGAPYGALGVLGEDGSLIQFVHRGLPEEMVRRIGHPPEGKGLLGAITWTDQPIRLTKVSDHPEAAGFPAAHPPMDSFLGVSIRIGEQVFGNLYLGGKDGGFTEKDEALVEALAVIAGTAISTIRVQARLRRAAVLEDRQRIARDLHDSIIQDLFAVGLTLQMVGANAEDDEVRTSIRQAAEQLDASIAALRRFIFDLRPPVWGTRDLKEELSDLLGRLAVPYDTSIAIGVTGPVDDLPAELVEDILQVVREAASNALRHAKADLVSVSISRGVDRLLVTITDRGAGFDPATTPKGMGLENIKSRAEAAGGEAEIISAPGEGTTVRVVLPV